MTNHRPEKLNSLVQDELSKIIQKEIDFEKGVLVSISKVEVSPDVAHAKIHISVIPEKNERAALEKLRENIYSIQQELNNKLVLKTVPKINFTIDDTLKKASHMEELFKEVSQ